MTRENDRYIVVVVTEEFKGLQFARICRCSALDHTLRRLKYGCPLWLQYEVIVQSENVPVYFQEFHRHLLDTPGVHPVTIRSHWFIRNVSFDNAVNRWLAHASARAQVQPLPEEDIRRWIPAPPVATPDPTPGAISKKVVPANQ